MTTNAVSSQPHANANRQKLQPGQPAPNFTVKDVNGRTIALSDYRGRKVLLVLARSVGCPVCNLHFHQLESHADEFEAKGLTVIMVSESSVEVMQQYLDGTTVYSVMVPNPDKSLYNLYGVERSFGKVIKGLVNGVVSKAQRGKALYTQSIKMDGNVDRIGAEFLINETGTIAVAHYGQYLGDELPIETIQRLLAKAS